MSPQIVELAMCSLSAALRSSTNWSQERLDERITDKWMHEHVGMARTVESPSGPVDVILNRHQVSELSHCIASSPHFF